MAHAMFTAAVKAWLKRAVLVLAAGAIAATAAAATEDEVVRRKSVAILLKVMSYDRNFSQRFTEGLRVGVMAKGDSAQSGDCAATTMKAFSAFGSKRLKGKSIKAKRYNVASTAELDSILGAQGPNALFLSEGMDSMLAAVAKQARARKLLVVACDADHVRDGVAAIAVVRGPDDKPKIYINLKTAQAQGADFDARVLKMAEVIK